MPRIILVNEGWLVGKERKRVGGTYREGNNGCMTPVSKWSGGRIPLRKTTIQIREETYSTLQMATKDNNDGRGDRISNGGRVPSSMPFVACLNTWRWHRPGIEQGTLWLGRRTKCGVRVQWVACGNRCSALKRHPQGLVLKLGGGWAHATKPHGHFSQILLGCRVGTLENVWHGTWLLCAGSCAGCPVLSETHP